MEPAPTQTSTPPWIRRWVVTIASGRPVMKCGHLIDRMEYEYGPPTVGHSVPDDMPYGGIINETSDPVLFLVSVFTGGGFDQMKPVIMGPDVFEKFGFSAPAQ